VHKKSRFLLSIAKEKTTVHYLPQEKKAKERTWSYERNLSAEQRRIIPNLR